METPSYTPEPNAVAHECEAAIINGVAQYFGLQAASLKVLFDGATEEDDGTVTFEVQHQTGIYGVNATYVEGTLENMTFADLQQPLDYKSS